jgi:hypothetical protein
MTRRYALVLCLLSIVTTSSSAAAQTFSGGFVTPFQRTVSTTVQGVASRAVLTLTVPAGKRLIIQHVSARLAPTLTSGGVGLESWSVTTTAGGSVATHFLAKPHQAFGLAVGENAVASQQVTLYADGGTTVTLTVDLLFQDEADELTTVDWSVSGMLVGV